MRDQDKILYFLRVVGPTIPSKVAKNINSEILIASAHLSDLTAQGKVKISHLKIGGSPLYYLPGQEDQLYHFAAGNLNPKDYQVLERLKQEKVLRENTIDLLSKVALRSIQDFAVPLHVTITGNKEIFWKWHLLSDQDTSTIIKSMLFGEAPSPPEAKPAAEEQQSLAQVLPQEPQPPRPVPENLPQPEPQEPEPAATASESKAAPKAKRSYKKRTSPADSFLPAIEQYFQERDIIVQEREVIRKNGEINYLLTVPSVVGKLTYFCKVKKKARCDEGDVSSAYMEAQIKKLPLLFLYTNEITKKAEEMLATTAFLNAIVKKMKDD